MRKHKNRDPQVLNRDPVVESVRVEQTEQPPNVPAPLPHALRIDIPKVVCKRCGGSAFNNCHATRPSKAVDKMIRRKQCMRCGQWYVMASEPTQIERSRYW